MGDSVSTYVGRPGSTIIGLIYFSVDNGASWEEKSTGLPADIFNCFLVKCPPDRTGMDQRAIGFAINSHYCWYKK